MDEPILRIRLFGGFQLVYGSEPWTQLTSPRQQSLIAYLLLHRDRPQARRTVAFQFWPDSSEKQALTNLRRELYHLRSRLPDAEAFLDIQRSSVQWRPSAPYSLDVGAFMAAGQAAARETNPESARQNLELALSLYKGPLLPAFHQEWVLAHREQFEQQYERTLNELHELAAARGDYETAVHYTERLIRLNPLSESAYGKLIRLHIGRGDRAEALRVYQLCAETLRFELGVDPGPEMGKYYAKLTTAKRTGGLRRNFPAQATRFIGRQAELDRLTSMLAQPECRLLTLVGPGGIGKTRLAMQTALRIEAEIPENYTDGLFFIPLASVEGTDQMLIAIASALSFRFQVQDKPENELRDYLREKNLLLVLDTFEHLLPHRSLLMGLVEASEGLRLLVTSRARLNLKQEQVFDVGGLEFGTSNPEANWEVSSAAQLFYESASRVQVEWSAEERQDLAVSRICQLVEGMPLAIELSAFWARFLTAAEIAEEIQRELDFLQADQIDLPKRHRSLRTVFDRSWALLTEDEARTLRRLSVFQSRFGRVAGRQVAGANMHLLSRLVDKSMLQWHPEGFFDMHPLLRQYAAEKQATLPADQGHTQTLFWAFYTELLESLQDDLMGSDQMSALARIEAEINNIRAAWRWATQAGDWVAIERAMQPLFLFYDLHSWFQEGADQFAKAADSLEAIEQNGNGQDHQELLYWKLRLYQASMSYRLGQYDEAQALLAACERGLDELDAHTATAHVQLRRGQIAFRRGDFEAARGYLETCLPVFRASGDAWEAATALSFLGDVMRSLGDYSAARSHLHESLAIRKEIGNPARVADSLNTLGILISDMGDYPVGLEKFQESLAIRRTLDDPWGVAKTLNNLGLLRTLMGDLEQARKHHEESLALRREIGNPFGVAIALHNLGRVAMQKEDRTGAEARFHEALVLRRQINTKPGIASSLNMLGRLSLEAGDEVGARVYFKEALQLAVDIQAVPMILSIADEIAGLLIRWEQYAIAREVLSFILDHSGTDSNTRNEAIKRLQELHDKLQTAALDTPAAMNHLQSVDQLIDRLLAVL